VIHRVYSLVAVMVLALRRPSDRILFLKRGVAAFDGINENIAEWGHGSGQLGKDVAAHHADFHRCASPDAGNPGLALDEGHLSKEFPFLQYG